MTRSSYGAAAGLLREDAAASGDRELEAQYRTGQARGLLEEVARDATTMSSMGVGRAMQLAWLAEAYLLEGRLDDARERAQQAVSLARRHRVRSHEAWSLCLLGEIASRGDPPAVETAEGDGREASALAGELRMRPLVAHCHFHLTSSSGRPTSTSGPPESI